MGKLYGSSAVVSQTISMSLPAPWDDRVAVSTYDDLTKLNAYKGLMVYVEDENTYYTYTKEKTSDSFVWLKGNLGGLDSEDGETLISAIRALLAEVAKMRNSFFYGMNSYNNEDTASSVVISEYEDVTDEEPLWAVAETDLSEAYTLPLDATHDLTPTDNVSIDDPNQLGISGTATIALTPFLTSAQTDSKLFIYITSSGLNIQINLSDVNTNETKTIDLNTLGLSDTTMYNYLIVISRKLSAAGKLFISITVDNRNTDQNLAEGYWTGDGLQEAYYDLGADYTIDSVLFTDLTIYKFNVYYRYQDFNDSIVPTTYKPSDETYKYKVAHLTIRSVESTEILEELKPALLTNELIYCEGTLALYIKTKNDIIKLGTSTEETPGTDDMETQDVLDILAKVGLVLEDYTSSNYGDNVTFSNIADITFINEETGNSFLVTVDPNGNLRTKKIVTDTVYNNIKNLYSDNSTNSVSEGYNSRGFIGRYGIKLAANTNYTAAGNMGPYSDRVRIGAIYAPLASDKVFGCSHCYIELENTSSEMDLPLTDFYLHYCYPKKNNDGSYTLTVETLALTGTLKAGSSYLIRGAKKTISANTFINVTEYDQEWYTSNKELIDFTLDTSITDTTYGWGLALTYCDAKMIADKADQTIITPYISPDTILSTNTTTFYGGYVDSIYLNRKWNGASWCPGATLPTLISNSILKNTFFLDPANQAYRALNSLDSNTLRWAKAAEYMYVQLNNDVIEFPGSTESYPVTMFAPKCNKNVCSDKTLLNETKPNAVTVSFGINIHTTRCFNWVSAGLFDEYVWIRLSGTTAWQRFESYGGSGKGDSVTSMSKVSWSTDILTAVYNRITSTFPGSGTIYTVHKCIVNVQDEKESGSPIKYEYVVGRADKNGNPHSEHTSDIQYFTIYPNNYVPRVYQVTDQQGFHWIEYQPWAAAAEAINSLINEDLEYETVIVDSYYVNEASGTMADAYATVNTDFKDVKSLVKNTYAKVTRSFNSNTTYYTLDTTTGTSVYVAASETSPKDGVQYYKVATTNYVEASVTEFAANVKYYVADTTKDPVEYSETKDTEPQEGTTYYTQVNTYARVSLTPAFESNTKYFVLNGSEYVETADTTPTETINYYTLTYTLKYTRNTNIMPILINTGDMTQNGTRVNEWLDYYNAGKCLFNHLEQMNVVGNNDLCQSSDYTDSDGNVTKANEILGTGDDDGKSNPYYFQVFYCYEIPSGIIQDTEVTPIINGVYVPSIYYFGNSNYMYLMVNSELTEKTCRYYLKLDNGTTFYNAYTGWMIPNSSEDTYPTNLTWTPIYNILYAILKENKEKSIIAACHEMPFTVITTSNLIIGTENLFRNINKTSTVTSLIGSHLNQISVSDTCHGIHWFSRLLENFDIKLCIGGHKHTYSVTYPVRERYIYNGIDNYTTEGYPKMTMEKDLSNDLLTWTADVKLHTESNDASTTSTVNLTKFPIVCRNGYNTTNNKTVYSPCSPASDLTNGVYYFMCQATGYKLTSNKELPSAGLAFSEILPLTDSVINGTKVTDTASGELQYPMYAVIHQSKNKYDIELVRLHNILTESKHKFTQQSYGSGKVKKQYLHKNTSNPTGIWEDKKINNYILEIS